MISLNAMAPPTVEAAVFDLIHLLRDAQAAAARIREYREAAAELRNMVEQMRKTQAGFDRAEAQFKSDMQAERASCDLALRDARQKFDAERITQENALQARAARLTELEAKVAADAAENTRIRQSLEHRLSLLKQAASAA